MATCLQCVSFSFTMGLYHGVLVLQWVCTAEFYFSMGLYRGVLVLRWVCTGESKCGFKCGAVWGGGNARFGVDPRTALMHCQPENFT
jgi:hypothetical protein